MSPTHRIDPRIRALGKARIDVTRRARDEQEWQRMWHAPRFPFPFSWGQGLKHCIQYVVDDFAAEVGFFIDVLGFPVSAFSPNYAQFTTPEEDIYFGIVCCKRECQQHTAGFTAHPIFCTRLAAHDCRIGKARRQI